MIIVGKDFLMSRDLNIKQKNMIVQEVKVNIQMEIPNPYTVTTDSYFKIMELNDHETYHQNLENFLQDLSCRTTTRQQYGLQIV